MNIVNVTQYAASLLVNLGADGRKDGSCSVAQEEYDA
jgi:hypothetical protein